MFDFNRSIPDFAYKCFNSQKFSLLAGCAEIIQINRHIWLNGNSGWLALGGYPANPSDN